MKKKKNSFYLIIIVISLIIICFLSYKIYFLKKRNENQKEISDNKSSTQEKEKKKTEQELKLERLENIHKKITFFKMENLDRYLSYKEKHKDLKNEDIVIRVNIGLDKEFFTNSKEAPHKYEKTVLANKYNFLGSDYIPKDLTKINSKCTIGTQTLVKEAQENFEKLCNDARKDGYFIKIISSYRSYNRQKILYNNYAKRDGEKAADTYSSRAGYSEHQTGLVVDVTKENGSFLKFGHTKEFEWMKENAHKYGFILRYTKEFESITGYTSEPWHYRYVGVDIASYIHEHPMSYEEYFVRFLDNK